MPSKGVNVDKTLDTEVRDPSLEPYKRILPSRESRTALRERGLSWVLSSNVSGVGVEKKDLYVRFHNGSIYKYFNAGSSYEDMLKASSKGRWVWDNLRRRNVSYTKVGDMPLDEDVAIDDEEVMRIGITTKQLREVKDMATIHEQVLQEKMIKPLKDSFRERAEEAKEKEPRTLGPDIEEEPPQQKPLEMKPVSKERAEKAKVYKKEVESYEELFDTTTEAWNNWTKEEKEYITSYTSADYDTVNGVASGRINPNELDDRTMLKAKESVESITKAIRKSPRIQKDMKVFRDSTADELKHHIGITDEEIQNRDFDKYIGKQYVDKSFKSTYVSNEQSFSEKWGEEQEMVFEIFTPEGTEAIYAEPFSYMNNQEDNLRGIRWDGKTKADMADGLGEDEMILQRNSRYNVRNIRKENGILKVDVDVIGVEDDE